MGSNLEPIGQEIVGHYTFRAIRTDSEVKIYTPKVYREVWPGSFLVSILGGQMTFMTSLPPAHIKNLMTPGVKRFFYLSEVFIPWKINLPKNILFAYQEEESGRVFFVLESTGEVNAVLRQSASRANAEAKHKSRLFLVLLFPLSMFLYKWVFGNAFVRAKPLPPFDAFQSFLAKTYKKGN